MPKRRAQQEFRGQGFERFADSFGGGSGKTNPKHKRPLDSKLPVHLTLKAAKSVLRLPCTYGKVEALITEVARKYGVRTYKSANVGNHLHLAIKISHVRRWAGFIRELTGRLGLALRGIMGGQKLWLARPHTRIVRGWRKAFVIVKEYIELNILEAEGILSRRQIKTLKDLRAVFYQEPSGGTLQSV